MSPIWVLYHGTGHTSAKDTPRQGSKGGAFLTSWLPTYQGAAPAPTLRLSPLFPGVPSEVVSFSATSLHQDRRNLVTVPPVCGAKWTGCKVARWPTRPIRFAFQINKEWLFRVCPKQYLGYTYTKKNSVFFWDLNLDGCPVFLWLNPATLAGCKELGKPSMWSFKTLGLAPCYGEGVRCE
jgi:hypothetical protein